MRCPRRNELPPPPAGHAGWPWTEETPPRAWPEGFTLPRVTVVTPSLNQGRFLEETIRSVLLQSYADLEYIVVDGGSTDESIEIIRKYEPWLAAWVSERDGGQSEAINKGWRMGTGSIMAWLNSDDSYMPGTVTAAVRAFQDMPAPSLVYGDYQIVDEASRPVHAVKTKPFDLRAELLGNLVPQPTVFLRQEVLAEVGMLDEKLHYAMDYDLWVRAGRKFSIQHEPEICARFRLCPGTKSASQAEAFLAETLRIVERELGCGGLAESVGLTLAEARGAAHRSTGLDCYELCQMAAARRHFASAIRAYPPLALDRLVLSCLVKSLFGPRLIGTLRHLRRGPPLDPDVAGLGHG